MKNLVIIDPGHGGSDPGAQGRVFKEKELNLWIALRVKDLLEELGRNVLLTREIDIYVPLYERVIFANEKRATAFVSIHHNAFSEPSSSGWEIFYYKGSGEGRRLARSIASQFKIKLPLNRRGIKNDKKFYVLKKTICPAVLVEVCFITNAEDERWIGEPANRQMVAEAIAVGIDKWLEKRTS